jgi:hypothetical protein
MPFGKISAPSEKSCPHRKKTSCTLALSNEVNRKNSYPSLQLNPVLRNNASSVKDQVLQCSIVGALCVRAFFFSTTLVQAFLSL